MYWRRARKYYQYYTPWLIDTHPAFFQKKLTSFCGKSPPEHLISKSDFRFGIVNNRPGNIRKHVDSAGTRPRTHAVKTRHGWSSTHKGTHVRLLRKLRAIEPMKLIISANITEWCDVIRLCVLTHSLTYSLTHSINQSINHRGLLQ